MVFVEGSILYDRFKNKLHSVQCSLSVSSTAAPVVNEHSLSVRVRTHEESVFSLRQIDHDYLFISHYSQQISYT